MGGGGGGGCVGVWVGLGGVWGCGGVCVFCFLGGGCWVEGGGFGFGFCVWVSFLGLLVVFFLGFWGGGFGFEWVGFVCLCGGFCCGGGVFGVGGWWGELFLGGVCCVVVFFWFWGLNFCLITQPPRFAPASL